MKQRKEELTRLRRLSYSDLLAAQALAWHDMVNPPEGRADPFSQLITRGFYIDTTIELKRRWEGWE